MPLPINGANSYAERIREVNYVLLRVNCVSETNTCVLAYRFSSSPSLQYRGRDRAARAGIRASAVLAVDEVERPRGGWPTCLKVRSSGLGTDQVCGSKRRRGLRRPVGLWLKARAACLSASSRISLEYPQSPPVQCLFLGPKPSLSKGLGRFSGKDSGRICASSIRRATGLPRS